MFSKELIETAVNWWAERVTGKCVHDNGDRSETSAFAGLLADYMIEPVSNQDIINRYKESLAKHILKTSENNKELYLSCDYFPDYILATAAKEAGISVRNYPWKTSMILSEKKIEVSEGYGQPYRTIYFE